jgi:uracil-DNA glycosylase family 4
MTDRKDFSLLIDDVNNYLRFMTESGWKGFECSEKSLEIINRWGGKNYSDDIQTEPKLTETLDSIRMDLGECRRCKLHKDRTNIVFGVGSPEARLVFVGEGPGYDEDIKGEPFVGKAGQLLTKIILAMNLTRDEVYICNIIKCRPPGNRNPETDEIRACSPFLERQISVINPDFICALGTFAAQTLLETYTPISRLRGRFQRYLGVRVLPTYHPAYLLRNPGKKREVWDDIQKLMKEMGL